VAHQWPSSEVATANTSGSHFKLDRPQMVLNGASQGTRKSSYPPLFCIDAVVVIRFF